MWIKQPRDYITVVQTFSIKNHLAMCLFKAVPLWLTHTHTHTRTGGETKSVSRLLYEIATREGPRHLFKGLMPRLIAVPSMMSVFYVINEELEKFLLGKEFPRWPSVDLAMTQNRNLNHNNRVIVGASPHHIHHASNQLLDRPLSSTQSRCRCLSLHVVIHVCMFVCLWAVLSFWTSV